MRIILIVLVSLIGAQQTECADMVSSLFPRQVFSNMTPVGTWTATVNWTKNPENSDSDVLMGSLAFHPFNNKVSCSDIAFLQIAQMRTNAGGNVTWTGGEENRNLMRTEDGYYVDHMATKCQKGKYCSPYFSDYWPNQGGSKNGMSTVTKNTSATLLDYPFGWAIIQSIRLEACAVCKETTRVYGCLRWGAEWTINNDRNFFTIEWLPQPSPTFVDTVQRFYQFYSYH